MNAKDRNRLIELYDLIDKVPFAQDGSGAMSASVKGFVDYCADMREFIPAFKQTLYALVCEGRNGLEVGSDYEPVDTMIDALKAWVRERGRQQWERPTIYFSFFYEKYKEEQERQ